jgi:AcrR family transcriptional regulator
MARARKEAAKPAAAPARGGRANNRGEDHNSRHDLVVEAILDEAARLFADRGIDGTGIRDIAEAMNMSRPGIYHYFDSKTELLEQVLEGYTSGTTEFLREVRFDTSRTPLEKMRAMVTGLALRVAAKPAHVRLLAHYERRLPGHLSDEVARGRRAAFEHLAHVIGECVESGDFRPIDPVVTGYALFGMCHWIAWWYRPEGPMSAETIAEGFTELALQGLMRPDGRRGATSIQHAVSLLREDLEYLQRLAGM